MILCDTDVIIDIIRRHPPAVAWAQSVATEELVIPGYVAMELVHGCHILHDVKTVLATLQPYRLVWPSSKYCDRAFQTLLDLRLSHGIDLVDTLIAQTAIALQVPLHTFNLKHFAPVPELRTAQPYQR
jgi:hypothetical protein